MTLLWAPEALDDLAAVKAYIARHDPQAAQRMLIRIREAVERLNTAPNAGRPGRVGGTRELVVAGSPFIVPYRVTARGVEILRVYHGARKWPDRL
jgi:toxin ParE1/3/4